MCSASSPFVFQTFHMVCQVKKGLSTTLTLPLLGLDCKFKANCPLVRPWPIVGVLSVGVFLRDRSPHLDEFWRKPRKTPNG